MIQRMIWVAIAAALLLWIFANIERVTVRRHEGMQEEAVQNPFLAAERLFSRLGRKMKHIRRGSEFDALVAGANGVLILKQAEHTFTPQQAEQLLKWVEHGGYLIAEVNVSDKANFLAQTFGVESASPKNRANAADHVEVVLPDDPLRYRLFARSRSLQGLAVGGKRPQWQAGEDGAQMLHYAHGRGNVTLVGSLSFLANGQIGQFDHAELAWALLQRYQPDGVIHLARRSKYPPLWRWLTESAWMAVISFVLLIVLWLWSVIPRFGGLRAAPEAARRDLAQHLFAIGRSLWREGGLGSLRERVRQEVAQRLALRHPALDRRPANERRAALARMSGLAERDIRKALDDKQALPSPEDFTRTMRILQRLECGQKTKTIK
ncbi:MAG: hypothetical protein LBB76_05325 [Azoarcus sp.]|jgi:hypothetical protein|nr:hypothetical protein [Azoarcus sp.]